MGQLALTNCGWGFLIFVADARTGRLCSSSAPFLLPVAPPGTAARPSFRQLIRHRRRGGRTPPGLRPCPRPHTLAVTIRTTGRANVPTGQLLLHRTAFLQGGAALAPNAARSSTGRRRRSTSGWGKPGTWGRAAAVSRREGHCNAGRCAGEYRRSRSGPPVWAVVVGIGKADQASPLGGGRSRPQVR